MEIVKVIKYNGSPNVLAWKYPNSELGTWSQLVVAESQEAILFKGGQALDWFGPGRHSLETANIPLLNKLVNLPFGGKSPFAAEVWYINKLAVLNVKWGTPTPIQLQDPKYNVFVPLRAFGQFGIKISDSKIFLQRIVGTLPSFTSIDIIKYFRGLYLTKVKDHISRYLTEKRISLLEINSYINEISDSLKDSIGPIFAEYGIELLNFYVNDINAPEEDSAVIKLKEALAKKAEMDIVGYSYTQERSFDTLEGAAKNPTSGSSQLMGAGMGLGMGLGMGQNFGDAFSNIGKNINTSSSQECPSCNNVIESTYKYCPFCGKDLENIGQDKFICPKCASYNKKDLKFCGNCGHQLFETCPACGESVDEKQRFCSKCGKSLIKQCHICGYEIDDSLKFCPNCGKNVEVDYNE